MTSQSRRYIVKILDDEESRRSAWRTEIETCLTQLGIQDRYEISTITPEEWKIEHAVLHGRREEARKSRRNTSDVPDADPFGNEESLLDHTDILFVDYDLFELSDESDLTGEIVSYLARCFSDCRYIVSVNQFEHGTPTFDLRMRGNLASFADLNISPDDMSNQNLWKKGSKTETFGPWHWPELAHVVESHESRVMDVLANFEHKILDWFGLGDATTMPLAASDFLSGIGTSPEDITFAGFAHNSLQGLRFKDGLMSKLSGARICASRIKKWLDHTFVAGQEVLIDAPHLVFRFPSLLSSDFDALDSWNKVASAEPAIKSDIIASALFPRTHWLDRPTWLGHIVRRMQEVEEIIDPWTMKKPPFVFCEDTSSFVERSEAKTFVSDVESPHRTRFVKNMAGVRYVPASRLART